MRFFRIYITVFIILFFLVCAAVILVKGKAVSDPEIADDILAFTEETYKTILYNNGTPGIYTKDLKDYGIIKPGGEKELTKKIVYLTDKQYYEFADRIYKTKFSIDYLKRVFVLEIRDAYEEANINIRQIAKRIKRETGEDKRLYARKVVEYIVENFEYDTRDINQGDTARAFLTKKAVCEIYADIFFRFMREADIPARIVVNDAHAWNMIKLDDNWYHVDITCMVRDGDISKYFCISTDRILETRKYDVSSYPQE